MEKIPTQSHLEGIQLTPEVIKENFKNKRINPDKAFNNLYSAFPDDMERASRLQGLYETQQEKDELGFLGEALVFNRLEEGALGSSITARGTSVYDDLFHGADVVVESTGRQQRDPIVSSIDVTVGQQATGTQTRSKFESEGVVHEVGLEKKLERVKRHIEYIAQYPRERAVEMFAWLQSGGLSHTRNSANQKQFDEAEKLMLLKYYKNPSTSENPHKPHFVLAGPQVVLSIDRSFINKTFSGSQQEKAIRDIDALIQVEVPFAVAAITQYLDNYAAHLSKNRQAPNLFFDMTRAACKAWELTFATEQYELRIQKAIQTCLKDPELKKQVLYYQQTLNTAFNLK